MVVERILRITSTAGP